MINSDSPIPLHLQISQWLEKEIKKGIYDERIPSERELMERFSVSRTTIREAVSRLVNEGTLTKIHGKGTYISKKPPVHEWLSQLNSFSETVTNMGMKPGSKLLYSGEDIDSEQAADVFDQDHLYTIRRLRYANSTPIAIEKHYYRRDVGIKLTNYDLNTATIYDLLENQLGIVLSEAEQFISSETTNLHDSKLLEVMPNSSVLSVERIIYDQHGQPVEFYQGYFRPDMYVFRLKTKRKSPPSF
ncbi:GntR family transcriptional regulator [Bacillus sp. AK128]